MAIINRMFALNEQGVVVNNQIVALNIDWVLVSSISTLLAVVVAIIALWWQGRLTHRIMYYEFVWRLADQFRNSEQIIQKRQHFAQSYLNGDMSDEVDDIFDFLNIIGVLTIEGVLKEDLVKSTLGYWIIRYWIINEDYIKQRRAELDYPGLWAHYEDNYKRMIRLEAKYQKCSPKDVKLPSGKHLYKFLMEESRSDFIVGDIQSSANKLGIQIGNGNIVKETLLNKPRQVTE